MNPVHDASCLLEEPGPSTASHPDDSAVLQTRSLSLSYGRHRVLQDVSLALPRGQITGLIGPSGSGKTSFLSCLNRLTDLFPGSRIQGEILLDNQTIHGPGVDLLELRRQIGMIFQKPNPFPFSIRRNLDLPLREHGWKNRSEREAHMERALQDVGLWGEVSHRLDSPAHKLSGGQQQRLCIARALALEPEILLLDEPCSALDPLSSGVVEELILSLQGRYTVLIVTHNLAQARRLAQQVALFWARPGQSTLVECGNVQQIFQAPRETLTQEYVAGVRG